MKRPRTILALALALPLAAAALTPAEGVACYWDYDTLAMEKRRFPDALELLSGKFLRRSDAYYRWRVADRRGRLTALDDAGRDAAEALGWADDLAVALDKIGAHDEAIAAAQRVLARHPDRYESLANLGTFQLHAGQFDEGLANIKRALVINPDAHFGREIIQQRLVEYVLQVRARRPTGLPLHIENRAGAIAIMRDPARYEAQNLEPTIPWLGAPLFGTRGFASYVESKGHTREEALKGLLGMMRFGDHEHPILLEALGDVLLWKHSVKQDAKRLAARAYLKASYHVEDPWAALWYRARATLALVGHRRVTLAEVEESFTKELARGERYAQRIAADEARWIEDGDDPDARFARKYLRR